MPRTEDSTLVQHRSERAFCLGLETWRRHGHCSTSSVDVHIDTFVHEQSFSDSGSASFTNVETGSLQSRGVYPYLPMAQLSHDQFLGSTFQKWKFNFENNLRVKQHDFHRRCPFILNKNFVWGPCGDRLGDDPMALHQNIPWLGNCAYVAC